MTQPPTWTFVQMTSEAADEIAAWRYPEPYGFYDPSKDADDLAEFMDEASWHIGDLGQRDTILAVHREGVLHGFFSFAGSPDLCTIGLGLAPERTGRGLGASFVEAGLAFARKRWEVSRFRLEVASFNERAIKVYERLGFAAQRTLVREEGGVFVEFVEMTR